MKFQSHLIAACSPITEHRILTGYISTQKVRVIERPRRPEGVRQRKRGSRVERMCVCVCVRERERGKERGMGREGEGGRERVD